jgi:hypothetical protein
VTEPDGWLDKVQKLLAMAEDPSATSAEAEAFSAKAEALMIKFSIDAAMLQSRGERPVDKLISVSVDLGDPYANVKRDLTWSVAKALGCKAIHSYRWAWKGNKRSKSHYMTIVGFESDVDKVQALLASLFIQMSRAIVLNDYQRPYGEHLRTWRNAVGVGFTNAVHARLATLRKKATDEARIESTGTDLVLADRTAQVDDEYARLFPDSRTVSRTSSRSLAGYRNGVQAGNRADLNQPRMSNASRNGING